MILITVNTVSPSPVLSQELSIPKYAAIPCGRRLSNEASLMLYNPCEIIRFSVPVEVVNMLESVEERAVMVMAGDCPFNADGLEAITYDAASTFHTFSEDVVSQ